VGEKLSASVQTGPEAHLALCTRGTGSLSASVQTGPEAHLALCTRGTGSLSRR